MRRTRDRRERMSTRQPARQMVPEAPSTPLAVWQPPKRVGAVERRFIAARALLAEDTLCVGRLGSTPDTTAGADERYCAVLAVSSVNFALRSAEEQEAIIAGFSAWLNALSFPVQILVRVLPLALDAYLERPLRSLRALQAARAMAGGTAASDGVETTGSASGSVGASATLPPRPTAHTSGADAGAAPRARTRAAWIALISDHLEFVRELARRRRLLDRHFYVIIPADPEPVRRGRSGLVAPLVGLRKALGARTRPVRHREGDGSPGGVGVAAGTWQRQSAARQLLDLRVTEVVRQLGRMGLVARRVRGLELLQLYASCLTPQHAARHPLPAEVLASAGMPVTAARTGSGPYGPSRQDTASATPPARHTVAPDAGTASGAVRDTLIALDASSPGATAAAAGRGTPSGIPADRPNETASRPSHGGEAGPVLSSDHASSAGAPAPRRRWRPWPARRRTHRNGMESSGQLVLGFADLLAPEGAELARDWVRLGDEYARVLAVTGYPRHVYPGWLSRLIDTDVPLEVVLHLHPRDARAVLLRLRKRLVEFQSSRLLDQKAGRLPDAEREIAVRDIEQLQDELQRGDTRVFDLALYLLVRGSSLELLEQRTEQVRIALDTLLLVGRPVPYEQDLALTSCLPEAQDRLRRSRLLDTGSVATAFPFSSSTLSMREGILYGTVPRNGSLIILDPFSPQLENANAVVFAQSGAGKSYACKVQALRSLACGVAVAIVDPEDEYRRLCQMVGGQYVRLSPSSTQRLNPFDLLVSTTATPSSAAPAPTGAAGVERVEGGAAEGEEGEWDPLAEKIQALHTLLDLMLADHGPGLAGSLTQREKGLLDRALYETYRLSGITPDPSTHGRPAPLLRDLYGVLRGPDFREQDATGLADRLHRWVEGSLARLFSAPTNVRLDSSFVVFNIRDMDAELKPIGLALITDTVWTRMRRERGRLPRLLFIDEAWTLMQFPEGGRFLAALARRARKYYLGLVTITQDVQDFLGSEWGQTVLAQSAIKLLMKQDPSTIEAVARTFQLSQGERQFLLGCNKGEGLLFARGAHVALRVEASAQEHALATTNPRELAALEARAEATAAAAAAAAALSDGPDGPTTLQAETRHPRAHTGRAGDPLAPSPARDDAARAVPSTGTPDSPYEEDPA